MKQRLIVQRHATAAWADEPGSDRDKPLTAHGHVEAEQVARQLAALGWVPEGVISSDARRCQQTWQAMTGRFADDEIAVEVCEDLYLAGLGRLQREIAARSTPGLTTLMVIGHNPGFEMAVGWLSGEYIPMRPATAILLVTTADTWRAAINAPGQWQLAGVVRPR